MVDKTIVFRSKPQNVWDRRRTRAEALDQAMFEKAHFFPSPTQAQICLFTTGKFNFGTSNG